MARSRLSPSLLFYGLSLAVLLPAVAMAARQDTEGVVRAEYPAILAAWADGREAYALEQLDALETGLVREKRALRDVEDLWRAKLGVIRDAIAGSSTEILVPVVLLHHDAYRHYVAKRSSLLARHSQLMSAELAEYYAENSASPTARQLAGDFLSSLAGHLQSGLVMQRSAELFHKALQLDPTNFAAHMGLGSMFERRAEPEEAVLHYATAVRIDPGSAEALLRHAVCAARVGDKLLANRELDRALALDGPPWVLRVAYQEKARLQENPGAGEDIAREAGRRFPDSSRQRIQLAFLLERQRRSGQALAELSDLSGETEPESERYRYAHWPQEALESTRARLRQAAQAQNGDLTSAAARPQGFVPGE